MNKPDKLVLDYSKWRCGDDGPNMVGKGKIALLNEEGFMCCLGQWEHQLGATTDELLNRGEPHEIDTFIPLFCSQKYEPEDTDNGRRDNKLSDKAICINDDLETTPEEKIHQLTILLSNEGIQLEVINKP